MSSDLNRAEQKKFAQTVVTELIRIYARPVIEDNFSTIMETLAARIHDKDFTVSAAIKEIIKKLTRE